jgi:hypothetical protein
MTFFLNLPVQCISYRCVRFLNQSNVQYQVHVDSKDNVSTIYMDAKYTFGCDTQHSTSTGTRSTLDVDCIR